jgi:hypothetical protein
MVHPALAHWYPLRGLAVTLMVLLPLTAVLSALTIVAKLRHASVIDRAFRNESGLDRPTTDDLDAAEGFVGGALGGYFIIVLITGAVWIVWQWQHAKNAEQLGVRGGLGPAWAIAGWFLPLGSFVLPGLQLSQSSRGAGIHDGPAGITPRPRHTGLIVAWAVAFGLSGLLVFGSIGMEPQDEDFRFRSIRDLADEQVVADQVGAVGQVVAIVAAALAATLAWQLSADQRAAVDRARSQAGWPQQPPPPGAAGPPAWGSQPATPPAPPLPPRWGSQPAPPPPWGAPAAPPAPPAPPPAPPSPPPPPPA